MLTILTSVSGYSAYKHYTLNRDLAEAHSALGRVMQHAAQRGCPVWDQPTTILISAESHKAMRALLDRAVYDIENFNVAIGRVEK